jgi:hypothetical protein
MSNNLKFYYGVRTVRGKKLRTVYFFADNIRVENGDLLLMDESSTPKIYRAFARGTWLEVFSASCFDGTEIQEEHDYDDATGKDARFCANGRPH